MKHPSPPPGGRAVMSRRTILAGAGSLAGLLALPNLLTACAPQDQAPVRGAQQRALDAALQGEQQLLTLCRDLGRAADRDAAAHRAHAEALIALGAEAASPTTSAPSASSSTPTTATSRVQLVRAQRRQADALALASLVATPRSARLLASIAASDAALAALGTAGSRA